jgi:hypothetical protein
LEAVEKARAEAQAENDLKEHAPKIVNRDAVKAALLKDRAGTLAVLAAVAAPTPPKAFNRADGKSPNAPAAKNRAAEQAAAVNDHRAKCKCSFEEAWASVRAAQPDLFKEETEG